MPPQTIREIRHALGLSQREMAHRLGLQTKGAISHMESGRRRPTGPVLALLELLSREGKKKREKVGASG